MFVLTIDQRSSRSSPDAVPGLLVQLEGIDTRLGFERSVGDEAQGALSSATATVEAMMSVLDLGGWYIGLGVGEIDDPIPATSREASGSAFVAARVAVEAAKDIDARIAVRSARTTTEVSDLDAMLALVSLTIAERSASQRRTVEAMREHPDMTQKDVAQRLGVSPQAVSSALHRARFAEIERLRPTMVRMLERADLSGSFEGGRS